MQFQIKYTAWQACYFSIGSLAYLFHFEYKGSQN